jgi:hypothetical protein
MFEWGIWTNQASEERTSNEQENFCFFLVTGQEWRNCCEKNSDTAGAELFC